MKGSIKKIMPQGFGFIGPEDGAKDIFFHANSLVGVGIDDLREGDSVSFETEDTPKGVSAVNVQRA